MIAISLGLRRGEVLGLSWADVDLDVGRLQVRRQLERRNWRHGCADPDRCAEKPSQCPQRRDGGLVLARSVLRAPYSARQIASASALISASMNVDNRSRSRSGEAWVSCSCRKRAGSILGPAVIACSSLESTWKVSRRITR